MIANPRKKLTFRIIDTRNQNQSYGILMVTFSSSYLQERLNFKQILESLQNMLDNGGE